MPWSALIHTGFHVSRATQDTTRSTLVFEYGAITHFGPTFQTVLLTIAFHVEVLQPLWDKSERFGLFRFRSPLLTESILFLFLRILRCFTSPRIALPRLCIHLGVKPYYRYRVSPFGYLRIKACVPLPEAFRSLLRPSSPDDAKASIICCNWFMQTRIILGVYFTYLLYNQFTCFCLNFQRTKVLHYRLLIASIKPNLSSSIMRVKWWAQMDLNHRPRAYQARALTN